MKRRILALIFALILAFSMSTAALANESQDVTIQVIQKDIQSNNITWDSLNFIYTFSSADTGTWNADSANVTVTNSSPNASINVSSSMDTAGKGTVRGVTVSYTGNGTTTPLAPNGGQITYTVSISGAPTENLTVASTIVGVITVTIS